jgi:DNA modification methylase
MLELNKIYLGDCLDVMKDISDKSIDLIFADLPYGSTNCKWDSIINLEKLWEQYKRIIKDNGAILLFAQTPFDKVLGSSNLKWLKYEWIWEKHKQLDI